MTEATTPNIRILHQMARAGGTIMCKCLASMDGVVLLSEVHPRAVVLARQVLPAAAEQFSPFRQARDWFGLVDASDEAELRQRTGAARFTDVVALIAEKCAARGETLVLRDWSHLDFTGAPFEPNPPYRFRTVEALESHMPVTRCCTVRHPLDQWLSLRRLSILPEDYGVDQFLRGYRAFAEQAVELGFFRYEDFLDDTDAVLRGICQRLELSHDPAWRERWHLYNKLTGDGGAIRESNEIAPRPRKPVEPGLLAELAANADYRASIEMLGYQHPA